MAFKRPFLLTAQGSLTFSQTCRRSHTCMQNIKTTPLFAMPLMYKMPSLPRQARDKHRETQKTPCFLSTFQSSCPEPVLVKWSSLCRLWKWLMRGERRFAHRSMLVKPNALAAIVYSSSKGSVDWWNCSGSSVPPSKYRIVWVIPMLVPSLSW